MYSLEVSLACDGAVSTNIDFFPEAISLDKTYHAFPCVTWELVVYQLLILERDCCEVFFGQKYMDICFHVFCISQCEHNELTCFLPDRTLKQTIVDM